MISLVHQSKNIEYVYLMLTGANEYLENHDDLGGEIIEINKGKGLSYQITIEKPVIYNAEEFEPD